jgi:hypothetical protein
LLKLSFNVNECKPLAYGPGRPVLLTFDGDDLSVQPVEHVGAAIHLAVADLNAAKVGRCRLTVSKSVLKAPMVPALESIMA